MPAYIPMYTYMYMYMHIWLGPDDSRVEPFALTNGLCLYATMYFICYSIYYLLPYHWFYIEYYCFTMIQHSGNTYIVGFTMKCSVFTMNGVQAIRIWIALFWQWIGIQAIHLSLVLPWIALALQWISIQACTGCEHMASKQAPLRLKPW